MTAKCRQFGDPTRRDALFRLGATLCDLRKRAGMTQETKASKAPISIQTIRNWEASRHEPNPTRLRPAPNFGRYPRTTSSIQSTTPSRFPSGATAPKSTPTPSNERDRTRSWPRPGQPPQPDCTRPPSGATNKTPSTTPKPTWKPSPPCTADQHGGSCVKSTPRDDASNEPNRQRRRQPKRCSRTRSRRRTVWRSQT